VLETRQGWLAASQRRINVAEKIQGLDLGAKPSTVAAPFEGASQPRDCSPSLVLSLWPAIGFSVSGISMNRASRKILARHLTERMGCSRASRSSSCDSCAPISWRGVTVSRWWGSVCYVKEGGPDGKSECAFAVVDSEEGKEGKRSKW